MNKSLDKGSSTYKILYDDELDDESNKCGNTKKIKCQREHYTVNREEETGNVRIFCRMVNSRIKKA